MKKLPPKKAKAGMEDAAIARFYDNQTDPEVTAEIEAALNNPHTVMVPFPHPLLSDVLKLIEKKKKTA